MLLVGMRTGLLELDAGRMVVDEQAVTALAPATSGWNALVDGQVVIRFDHSEVMNVGQLPVKDGQSLAVLPDLGAVVGRTGARLAIVGPEVESLQAFEQVPGRDHWQNPANPTPDTRSMATSGEDLWVNIHVGGLWCSGDRGKSWRGVIQPDADVHEVRASDATVAVAAAVGFGWSENGGDAWTWTTDGLHAHYLRAACIDGETVYVSASDGPFTKRGAVYRARLGAPFVRCEQGLPAWFPGNIDSGHLDAAGGRVAIGFEKDVYVSEDDGNFWRRSEVPDLITAIRLGRT